MEQDKDLDSELEQNIAPQENSPSFDDVFSENDIQPAQEIQNVTEEQNPEGQTDEFADFQEINEISEKEADEEGFSGNNEEPQSMVTVRPVKFQEFELTEPNRSIKRNLDIMQDISMHISVELGRAKATIKEVMDYKEGSIVELDKIAGEQVEVYVNNKLVAKGEVIVIEDKFGVRVTSTSLPKTIQ